MYTMKRTIKLVAAVMLIAVLASACSKSVCPAYSKDTVKEQPADSDKG
jgi:hypothetical protein